jgi:hypothetical protein
MVARTNDEVLEYLASFYDLPVPEPEPDEWLLEGASGDEEAEFDGDEAARQAAGAAAAAAGMAEARGAPPAQLAELAELEARLERLAELEVGVEELASESASAATKAPTPAAVAAVSPAVAAVTGGSGASGASSRHRSRRASGLGTPPVVTAHAVSAEEVLHGLGEMHGGAGRGRR